MSALRDSSEEKRLAASHYLNVSSDIGGLTQWSSDVSNGRICDPPGLNGKNYRAISVVFLAGEHFESACQLPERL